MNRRIKNVWMLTILSSFLLIVLQSYWLCSSTTYSIGEAEKYNMDRAEHAVIAYLQQLGDSVRNRAHVGYVISGYFGGHKTAVTAICSPEGTDTIVDGRVMTKPAFRPIVEHRDTFYLREVDWQNADDCLNTYITFRLTHFNTAHFARQMRSVLGRDFVGAQMKTTRQRLWVTKVVETASLLHHETLVEVPFNPIEHQSVQIRMRVPVQPLLWGMMWQIVGSIIVTLLLLLSFAYLIKVMLQQNRVDKMRGDFVHTMIHELKRPVQTLKMCVLALDDDAIAEIVKEESDNLTAYLSKLRDVIRAEEQIPLNISEFDIRATLAHLADVFQKSSQKAVSITLDYLRPSATMRGDRELLQNVVSNLIENAVKYSGDKVNIRLTCRDTEHGSVAISVTDDGIGIPQEEQKRVWQKFYRCKTHSDLMQPGIGLGLSYVDMIVKAHGGRRLMRSEAGKGTEITVEIPQ